MAAKPTKRLTMAQALIAYLTQQYVSRDGQENRFFAGVRGRESFPGLTAPSMGPDSR